MFVSVMIEPGGLESGKFLVDILTRYGFEKIQRCCWESMKIKEEELISLKRDIDRVTDYYDKIRLYQFPVNGLFVLTEMKQKKWRKRQFSPVNAPVKKT
ncbi:MAG: CRISPR-associated protein Cas2 [Treponema sp.]|nr:CRISPR-associated protein Cas2 [Spirochaetia bacterium]MDD7459674.1 CRISPR-associated protein Cas2 [Spirochaetales bacterium]MDY5811666.1 CRISPR-associated protein Cas2 [Treponema sp.]MEE1180785.1 CRISPR-associated protein Cas2 [Treponema sp.]